MNHYPEYLRALKMAADEARATFHAHKTPANLGVNESIAADLTYRRLLRACAAAQAAYDKAADEYLAAQTGGLR